MIKVKDCETGETGFTENPYRVPLAEEPAAWFASLSGAFAFVTDQINKRRDALQWRKPKKKWWWP